MVGVHGQRIRDSRQCTHQSMIATCCVKMVLLRLEGHLLPEEKAGVGLAGPEDIPIEDRCTLRKLAESCFRLDTRRVKYLGYAAVNVRLLPPMPEHDASSNVVGSRLFRPWASLGLAQQGKHIMRGHCRPRSHIAAVTQTIYSSSSGNSKMARLVVAVIFRL